MVSSMCITVEDVRCARRAIDEYVDRSPCILSPRLRERTDCKLHLKMENLQRAGAERNAPCSTRGTVLASRGIP